MNPPAFKYQGPSYRSSIDGRQGLRNTATYRPSKAAVMPDVSSSDFVGIPITRFNTDKVSKPGKVVRWTGKEIAHGEFKADTDDLYQGYQTGTVDGRLPLAFDPVGRARTRHDVAGGSYNRDTGYVASNEDHPDTRVPNLDPQWQGKNSFLTASHPEPFPIEVSAKIRLK